MAGKISEMTAADTLTGSELVEVIQGGSNKKATVNDLLPVQFQENKTIDLNDKILTFLSGTISIPTNFVFGTAISQGSFKMYSPNGTLYVVSMQDGGTLSISED